MIYIDTKIEPQLKRTDSLFSGLYTRGDLIVWKGMVYVALNQKDLEFVCYEVELQMTYTILEFCREHRPRDEEDL